LGEAKKRDRPVGWGGYVDVEMNKLIGRCKKKKSQRCGRVAEGLCKSGLDQSLLYGGAS